jgi:branched-chain amino acid transport system substrate-binding protein
MRARAVLVLWGLATALGAVSPACAQQPIRIGASASLFGSYAVQGGYLREGYLLCQRHVNEQGGLMGRPLEFVIHDDGSDEKTAVRLYEQLMSEDKVDAVLGPYSSPITDAVAEISERHRKLMIAPAAATTSIWEKGRRHLVMMLAPGEGLSEGVLDLAARQGLKTVAVLRQDGLVANSIAKGAEALAPAKGLQVVAAESYRTSPEDFSELVKKVASAKPDVLIAASTRFPDLVAITRKMKEMDLHVKMLSSVPYGLLPEYYQQLGQQAELVFSGSFWETSLPYPGNQTFVADYEKEFKRTPAVQSAAAYAACRLLVDAARQSGNLEADALRATLVKLRTKTVLGDFAIDERGYQIGHKAVTIQWQDGKQVVVWPDELASGKLRLAASP